MPSPWVRRHLAEVEQIKDDEEIGRQIDEMRTPVGAGSTGGFGTALLASGFDLKSQPSVTLSAFAALGTKAPTMPGDTVLNPTGPAFVPMGRDERFMWPSLVRENAGDATAVSDFKQTVRGTTGSIERGITATTDKAELGVTLTHVTEAMRQLAVTISDVPNAVLEAGSQFRAFFDREGRFAVEQALDAHALAQIVASAPPFGNTGTGLIAQVRNGITAMRAEGASPSVLVVNASDAAGLDLAADAGGYVFPLRDTGASPLWGLRVVERPGTAPPYLIDPGMLGVLYLGSMRFDADPFSGFKRNLTTLRVETSALFHVRDSRGARRIAAT